MKTSILFIVCFVAATIQHAEGVISKCNGGSKATVYDRCNRKCTCSRGRLINCCRVRNEFTSMSNTERKRYLAAFKSLATHPKLKAKFQRLRVIHRRWFSTIIHNKSQFLPWHRWYLLQLEDLLQKIDCRVTVPYWAWSLWSHQPWGATSIWGTGLDGFGGNGRNGGCVRTGIFRRGQWKTARGGCLRREFEGTPPDEIQVAKTLSLTDFDEFELELRVELHDNIHCLIGGTMCTSDSAAAPEFFLHHGYVDKLWNDWQQKSTANKNAYFRSIKGRMRGTVYSRAQLIDIKKLPGGVSICYEEPNVNDAGQVSPVLRGFSLQQLQSIPHLPTSGITEKTKKLFNISDAEFARCNAIRRRLRGKLANGVSRRKPLLLGKDRLLGFQHLALPRIKAAGLLQG